MSRMSSVSRVWTAEAVRRIDADFNRSADTHLIPVQLSGYPVSAIRKRRSSIATTRIAASLPSSAAIPASRASAASTSSRRSFPEVVDRMIAVSDACSIAATRVISERLGRRCGGSTGTNIWACARLISEMATKGETGSVVSILCDQGERYASTYFNDAWSAQRKLDLASGVAALRAFFEGGRLP